MNEPKLFLQDTRRAAAAEAASRRLNQAENRGVDEDQYRRMKQKQSEKDRLDEQQRKYGNSNNDGLRVSSFFHLITLLIVHIYIFSGK